MTTTPDTFTLTVETGNAEVDLPTILRDLAARLESDCGSFDVQGTVRDLNGNTVGTWSR